MSVEQPTPINLTDDGIFCPVCQGDRATVGAIHSWNYSDGTFICTYAVCAACDRLLDLDDAAFVDRLYARIEIALVENYPELAGRLPDAYVPPDVSEPIAKPPEFKSVEERFPDWPGARASLQALVPERLAFVFRPPVTVALNLSAVSTLDSPEVYREEIQKRLDSVLREVSSWLQLVPLERFLNQNATPALICQMNAVLDDFQMKEEADGLPTIQNIMEHELGLKQFIPPFR